MTLFLMCMCLLVFRYCDLHITCNPYRLQWLISIRHYPLRSIVSLWFLPLFFSLSTNQEIEQQSTIEHWICIAKWLSFYNPDIRFHWYYAIVLHSQFLVFSFQNGYLQFMACITTITIIYSKKWFDLFTISTESKSKALIAFQNWFYCSTSFIIDIIQILNIGSFGNKMCVLDSFDRITKEICIAIEM